MLWLQVVFVTGEAAQAPEIFSSAFTQYGMSSSVLVLASCAGMGILLNYSIFLATLVCAGFVSDLIVLHRGAPPKLKTPCSCSTTARSPPPLWAFSR